MGGKILIEHVHANCKTQIIQLKRQRGTGRTRVKRQTPRQAGGSVVLGTLREAIALSHRDVAFSLLGCYVVDGPVSRTAACFERGSKTLAFRGRYAKNNSFYLN